MNEFKIDGENIILNVPYAEAYIPSDLFSKDTISLDDGGAVNSVVAAFYGDGVKCIGLFNMRFYDSPAQDRNSTKIRTLNVPNMIETYPTVGIERDVSLSIPENADPDKYMVLKYQRGDIVLPSRIQQNSDNCEKYLNMQLRGKIPSTIPYPILLNCWLANLAINGFNPKVPAVTYQAAISELIRCKSDPTIQFRKVAGKMKDLGSSIPYIATNTRSAASSTSVFNAITFEDMGSMITSSINMSRDNVKQSVSPVEQILYM